MRIPTGNFGTVVAEPQRQAQVRSSGAVGQALGNVANALGGVAQDMQDVERDRQQAELKKQRSQAAMTAATLTNELHDVHDEIGREVTEGKRPAAQAVSDFEKRRGELIAERTKDLMPDQRLVIDEHLTRISGSLTRNLNGVALRRTQQETGANLVAMGEQFQRAAMRDLPGAIGQWDAAVDAMGPAAGWDPEKIATTKQAFKEGATYNFANATLEGAAATGNIELVRAARAKLEGPEAEAIDPARRTALITKAYGYESSIEAANVRQQEKAQREQEKRENVAETAFRRAFDQSDQGVYLSNDAIRELAEATAGTSFAGKAQDLVKAQAGIAGFASMPIRAQQAEIERMRAAGATPGKGLNEVELQVLRKREKITEAAISAIQENPWEAAQKYGKLESAPMLSLTNVQEAQQIIGQRMKDIADVEVWAGRKISPLQPQEAEQIGRLVQALPPDQQSAALATFGKMIGDADRLAALARQIDTKDKVLGTAMIVGDLQTTQGRYLSELVIKGARAIKDKSITMDERKETGWRGAIANEIGDAFPNQEVREKMIEAAYYVQAGFAAEGGGADIRRAVRMVAGRIVDRNGSRIPLPRGMEEGDFEKRISSIKPVDLAAQAPGGKVFVGKTAVPLEQFVNSLPDAALVSSGHGRYNIRAGMGLVTNSQGKRITIEVRNGN